MSYITKSLTIIITLYGFSCVNSDYESYDYGYSQGHTRYTRNITLKQGVLRGVVMEPAVKRLPPMLPPVEVYRGIPYAAPPVRELRFMPTRGAPLWFGVKYADTFGPVCPQKFPDTKNMSQARKEYFLRLKQYLENQSEDCLYLNIYAPLQDADKIVRKYPVMVYIHGESFEWNSGNPYDGSVLAAYGNVIVVTLNFRLGILGFLKAGAEELSRSNFGLVDQVAALLWVKNNIAAFGGDPASVTLFGHGTGAVCASLLTISPMILQDGNHRLFHRAILTGGSALTDWALASDPLDVTYLVANASNCRLQDDFAGCLQRKKLDEIMAASADITSTYRTAFGPVVDSLVVPNDPKKSMSQYTDIFKRFELMYGVTELESIHLLGPVALQHGMLDKERDRELTHYISVRCAEEEELCFAQTLEKYNDSKLTSKNQEYEPDRVFTARDVLLDILSDARSVVPIVQMARYHAALNLQSYFYVFTHKTQSKEYLRNKSFNGEELPYVFGIPLDGPKNHFVDSYTDKEKLFSEIVMTYFCNFAYTGNPNMPRKNSFYSLGPASWTQFDIEWPEFDVKDESYLQLDIPPQPSKHYRSTEVIYWNDVFPELSDKRSYKPAPLPSVPTKEAPRIKKPPWIPWPTPERNTSASDFKRIQTPLRSPSTEVKQSDTTNVIIIIGGLFLIANLILFLFLYLKCFRRNGSITKADDLTESEVKGNRDKDEEALLINGCNIVNMLRKSSGSPNSYEAIKASSSSSKYKLSRQMSSSTIDAHTKVRDWITQEIIYKYSPRFSRQPKQAKQTKASDHLRDEFSLAVDAEKDSTLGRSPTRPVSPSDGPFFHQPAMKTSTITRPKTGKSAKVSVAVDATPSGRGVSVLMQRPIELTKSLDCPDLKPESQIPLRRSITLEDFSPRLANTKKELRKSTTSINLKYSDSQPSVIKIKHGYSKSEPIQDLNYTHRRKLRTFDPHYDVNVTCKDDHEQPSTPLTPEESLMTLKRRNCPKVLPDHPGRDILMHKRRSMPPPGLFLPIPELCFSSQPNSPVTKSFTKLPPVPPPRTTTLQKQSSNPLPVYLFEPVLIEKPQSPEPEVVCNNLYIGPLLPKNKGVSKGEEVNKQPIYDNLKKSSDSEAKCNKPKTMARANSNTSLRRADPKIIVLPTITRKVNDDKTNKHIPRVVVPDNQPQTHQTFAKPNTDQLEKVNKDDSTDLNIYAKSFGSGSNSAFAKPKTEQSEGSNDNCDINTESSQNDSATTSNLNKKSHIPTLVKNLSTNKGSSSSESTPSEESDTGTVVKRM